MMPRLFLPLALLAKAAALSQQNWLKLPDVNPGTFTRRDAASAAAVSAAATPVAATAASKTASRRAAEAEVQKWPRIPVWPSWAGGRVIPMGLPNADPFLLVAHHKHWFDPRDPLRGPFRAFGKATGLPYIDVEGFSMHPHRGFDILTYVLDGSDGFRHRDSLGGSKTYRGASAQWMRTGAGAMHEEFWETSEERRTSIELFQIWINLPASRKMDPPTVRYLGAAHGAPWRETVIDGTRVRTVLDAAILDVAICVEINQ